MTTKKELAEEYAKSLPTLEYQNLTHQMEPAELYVFLQRQAFIVGYEVGVKEAKKNKITPELMTRIKTLATKWP